jgi:hypothetical protein
MLATVRITHLFYTIKYWIVTFLQMCIVHRQQEQLLGYFILSNLAIINRYYFPFCDLSARLNMSLILSMNSLSQIHLAYCLLTYAEIVKFHNPSLALMNLHNGSDKSNSNKTAKATSAIPIAGILVAAALLSGLLSIFGSESAIAQQNMTGMNATGMNATGMNATGMNATGMNATGMNATGMNATGMNATGTSAIETLGG